MHSPDQPDSPHVEVNPSTDHIRTEYHPSTGRAPETEHLDSYIRKRKKAAAAPDPRPWYPAFETLEDFELAELALEACINDRHLDRLVKLICRVVNGKGRFTFEKGGDVRDGWERAAQRLAPVRLV